ncbi:regulator of G-protein signaling loco [Aricia agestis]|uniref:regulator of G-protein signaling loco n=1 Tax=Aricia agestis TaxID=91739 RepID=UPI001C202D9E|nr:regulator of G-protein signaling loco [Aricia agestis]
MVPQQQRRRRRRAALSRVPERRVVVARGAGGFGFTIAGQRPCVVSAVAAGGPAECAGLRAGDALMAVDGASVARAPHASVARLVASAQGPIALSVAPREPPPTDTEDTEPEERARTRRRYPPPRRRLQQALVHHPACHAAPSTSGVNEILHNLSRAQLTPNHAARLECRAVVGYLGTIETPQATAAAAPANVRAAVRKLRQERRPAAPVLLTVLPHALLLRRAAGQLLAQYHRDRIVFAGCGSEADRRFFGLVTSAEVAGSASHGCHVFAVDGRAADHEAHAARAREFRVTCTRDPVAERCLEFPPAADDVVAVIRGMYSLPADAGAPLRPISSLVQPASPPLPHLARRPGPRRRQDAANSPQPSNHSELTTSSTSDSGIGFHNDCRSVADRILVVEFGRPPAPGRDRRCPRRPVPLVGRPLDDGFLSNTTPVVDGFGGRGRPLDPDDALPGADLRPGPADHYNYNLAYERVYAEHAGHYEFVPAQLDVDDADRVAEAFGSVEIYEERRRRPDYRSNESVENVTVVSALSKASVDTVSAASKASADTLSVYSTRSHEEARPALRKHLRASLDDMLVLGLRDPPPEDKDEGKFVHPANVKLKVRKPKPLNIISKTRHMLSSKRDHSLSASAGDVSAAPGDSQELQAAASEPDLRNQSDQGSPFRRWTTSGGAGSSYRHHDHRQLFAKQMSEGAQGLSSNGGVARWSLGLEQLLADPAGDAAFTHFLDKEFAAENIRFWRSCEQYRQADGAARRELAAKIWERHLADRAPEPVNVDAAARRAAEPADHVEPPADLFIQAQKQIFNVMKFDSYPRFLRSGVHAECARADLRGQPPPYAPQDSDASKLKKSASNVSERRRSGGASLLPWRSRAASRDRAANPAPGTAPAPAPPAPAQPEPQVTDVVMSGALCRVVLPDGATSVVGVSAALPVGRLVERLLARRRLAARAYDVLLADAAPGEPRAVPPTAPSSALGGRTAAVERRAVLRLQLGGRALLVRCRPARRLRHVLRPVLARYCPGAAARVTLDARPVHPDTTAAELDGARLVLTLETDAAIPAPADTDDDLSDLALRLQDDDDDVSTHSSMSGISGASSSWPPAPLAAPAPAPDRVRAALKPGPALHNHPPDFLENLRETQRQRLSARTPPPLPPKPPRTAPTLV